MKIISYAQNQEDILLNRVFPEARVGFYIDVGANDPVWHSVTKLFYDRGWHGVNIEPEPGIFAKLQAERPRDLNLNVGVSDHEGTLTFFEAPSACGWSTFSPDQARQLREQGHQVIERAVPVTTLARICEQYADRPIDFLKVDAESHEREVLAGADWKRWRPRVVVIETNGWERWECLLLEAGYLFATFDGINRYYLRNEDRHLMPALATPVNALDEFIPYGYHRLIEELRGRLETCEELGPMALDVARRLQRLSERYPRLAATLRWVVRRSA